MNNKWWYLYSDFKFNFRNYIIDFFIDIFRINWVKICGLNSNLKTNIVKRSKTEYEMNNLYILGNKDNFGIFKNGYCMVNIFIDFIIF